MRSSICAVLLLCSSMTAYAKDNDLEVLAEFDDSTLTVEEFARREANLLSWAGISAGVDQIQARVEDLVFDSVAATKARSSGVAEDPDVQLQVNRILKAAFIKKEMPRDEIDVTNEEIEKFYQDNKERYRNPDLSKISHLLFRTKEEAQSARLKLGAGSWEPYAQRSPDPVTVRTRGSLGSIPQQSLLLPLANAISAAGQGTTSEPVKTVFGYHLLRLENAPTATYRPLEDLRKEIFDELVRQKQQARLATIKSELWKEYDVSIHRPAIEALVAKNTRARLDLDMTVGGKGPQVVGKVPDLQFISDSIDLGAVPYKDLTEGLLIGNGSDHEVKIERVGSTCPCIKTSIGKKVLAPGEVTRLTFTYSPQTVDDRGRVERVLFIDSNDTVRPKAFMKLRFDVKKGAK